MSSPAVPQAHFSRAVVQLRATAEEIARNIAAPRAEQVDRERIWPAHTMRALAEAGLMGMLVPKDLGGHGEGLVALAAVTEVLGTACASSAITYGMHCVGTAVMAAKPTDYHRERYLRPIAEGRHITTLSLSEPGSGANFFLPSTGLTVDGEDYVVQGKKHFVTNAGHADSYVVSTMASSAEPGEFSCLIVDAGAPGVTFEGEWDGLGMRGNAALTLRMDGARLPRANLLGREGDQIWYAFEVIAPMFVVAMAGAYLGIAQAAMNYTLAHVKSRIHSHSGDALAAFETVQYRIGEMWSRLEAARQHLYAAAFLGDTGSVDSLVPVISSKAEVSDVAVAVVNDAMSLCGGSAYRENSSLARMLRDVRASHVMAPTTDMLRIWAGRALLGQPLL